MLARRFGVRAGMVAMGTDQQSASNGFLAKVQQELLQCHGLIVDAED